MSFFDFSFNKTFVAKELKKGKCKATIYLVLMKINNSEAKKFSAIIPKKNTICDQKENSIDTTFY